MSVIKKYVGAYIPFLIYLGCLILLYFIFFYVLPKTTTLIALIGFFVIYAYIYISIPIWGFVMGKKVVKRMPKKSVLVCIIYAVITFGLMAFSGSMKYVFWECMYFNYPFSLSLFFERIAYNDSLYVSIVSFLSFTAGEVAQYIRSNHGG